MFRSPPDLLNKLAFGSLSEQAGKRSEKAGSPKSTKAENIWRRSMEDGRGREALSDDQLQQALRADNE